MAFTERNVTMSAITKATTIVQAGDTSGTLIQARAALEQGRKLFILESCYQTRRSLGPTCTRKRARIELRISTRFEKYLDVLNKLSKDDRLMVGDHYHPSKDDEVRCFAESTPANQLVRNTRRDVVYRTDPPSGAWHYEVLDIGRVGFVLAQRIDANAAATCVLAAPSVVKSDAICDSRNLDMLSSFRRCVVRPHQ